MDGAEGELLNIIQLGPYPKHAIIICIITVTIIGFTVKAFLFKFFNSKAKLGTIDRILVFELLMRASSPILGILVICALLGWKGKDFGAIGFGICSSIDIIYLFNISISIVIGTGLSILRLMYIFLGLKSKHWITLFSQLLPIASCALSIGSAVLVHILSIYKYNFFMDLCLGNEKRFYKSGEEFRTALILRRILLIQGMVFTLIEMTSYIVIFFYLANHNRIAVAMLFRNNATIHQQRRRRNLVSLQGHFSIHLTSLLFLICTYLVEILLPKQRTLMIEFCSLILPIFYFLIVPILQILSSHQISRYVWLEIQNIIISLFIVSH